MKIDCNDLREKAEKHKTDIRFEYLVQEVVDGNILVSDAANEYDVSGKEFVKKMNEYNCRPPFYIDKNRDLVISRTIRLDYIHSVADRILDSINSHVWKHTGNYGFADPEFSIKLKKFCFSIKSVKVTSVTDINETENDIESNPTTLYWECSPYDAESIDFGTNEYRLKLVNSDPATIYLCNLLNIYMTEPIARWDELI